ncbi:uncharacterized protein LOC130361066 [Hyla sarda]|uniref:uncharacterized protein LOC130361066 n=1 Tax=Hyla sarda TaxID=327740 RepID=UPI0024C2310B|nr:uncharacterized protein LOC130361066 [Hyla sarda]
MGTGRGGSVRGAARAADPQPRGRLLFISRYGPEHTPSSPPLPSGCSGTRLAPPPSRLAASQCQDTRARRGEEGAEVWGARTACVCAHRLTRRRKFHWNWRLLRSCPCASLAYALYQDSPIDNNRILSDTSSPLALFYLRRVTGYIGRSLIFSDHICYSSIHTSCRREEVNCHEVIKPNKSTLYAADYLGFCEFLYRRGRSLWGSCPYCSVSEADDAVWRGMVLYSSWRAEQLTANTRAAAETLQGRCSAPKDYIRLFIVTRPMPNGKASEVVLSSSVTCLSTASASQLSLQFRSKF